MLYAIESVGISSLLALPLLPPHAVIAVIIVAVNTDINNVFFILVSDFGRKVKLFCFNYQIKTENCLVECNKLHTFAAIYYRRLKYEKENSV